MTVDLAAVTARQQRTWSLGDYGRIGSALTWLGETLVVALDVHSGERVLDVAAGSGNASLPALRRHADVVCTDYVPDLLAQAERRAAADGYALRTEVADAQALPYADASFDVVMSTIGAMFAPDQEATARELLRVCRPGGRIGMANWTPDGMIGDLFRLVAGYVPPPAGVRPAVAWGDEAVVRALLGRGCSSLAVTPRTFPWRYPSAEACAEHFRAYYGPVNAAFAAVGAEREDALLADLVALFDRHSTATDGTMAAEVGYVEVVGVRA